MLGPGLTMHTFTKTVLAATLLLSSASAFAGGRTKLALRPGETVDKHGYSSIDGYTQKNAAYFAKYDRDVASGKIKGRYVVTKADRIANARGANPPGYNAALDLARPWVAGMFALSATVNPIGTKIATQQFLNANAYRLPF